MNNNKNPIFRRNNSNIFGENKGFILYFYNYLIDLY